MPVLRIPFDYFSRRIVSYPRLKFLRICHYFTSRMIAFVDGFACSSRRWGKDKMDEEPTNLIFSPRLSRINVKSFFEKEFRSFLGRSRFVYMFVYHSSKVNEFNIDDIYSMLHLLPSLKKNQLPSIQFSICTRVCNTSVAINTAIFF